MSLCKTLIKNYYLCQWVCSSEIMHKVDKYKICEKSEKWWRREA